MIYLYSVITTVAADVLATQGARALAAAVLTCFFLEYPDLSARRVKQVLHWGKCLWCLVGVYMHWG